MATSATPESIDDPLTPMGLLRVLHRRWIWAVASGLLMLTLGLLPLLHSPGYSATFTIRSVDGYDLSSLFYLGLLANRDPLASQIAEGGITVAAISDMTDERIFSVTGSDPAAVERGIAAATNVATTLEQTDREQTRAVQADSNTELASRVASYKELRTTLLAALNKDVPGGYGDLPSTIVSVTNALLRLQEDLRARPSLDSLDNPRIEVTHSAIVEQARPVRLLAIGLLGAALATGLLAAIVVDAAFRVRKALSAP